MSIQTADARIPVTLLTGFLGAGKTTLLNHLIKDPDAGRVAVIMNELGDVGLDHDLIEEATEETVLMQSGCLCCSIRGDLAKTMGTLIARLKQGDLNFNRVIIETTGIADPGPILQTLVLDELISQHFRMDGVVTLADAASGPVTLDKQFEAVHQIAIADLIVVTKTDLVTPTAHQQFETRLDEINGSARRVQAEHGHVPSGTLFGLSGTRPDAAHDDIETWLGRIDQEPKATDHAHSGSRDHHHDHHHHHDHGHHDHGHHHHDHDHHHAHHGNRIDTASIEITEPIPASVFDFWLDTLIALNGPNILRMKGIVHVEGMEWPFVFHAVQDFFDSPVPLKSWSGQDTTSKVVIIARDMHHDELKESLETLRLRPEALELALEEMMDQGTEEPA